MNEKKQEGPWHTVTPLRGKRPWRKMAFGELAVLGWHVLQVKAGTEFTVEALLERRGLVAVVPMRSEWRRLNRYVHRKVREEYPLAPRYVFVGFPDRARPAWGKVFDITMVHAVIGFDGRPWPMSGVLTALFLIRNMDHSVPDAWQYMRKGKEFDVGDVVDIVEGDHVGKRVRVSAIEGDAARVLLPLFGRLKVPLANLERSD